MNQPKVRGAGENREDRIALLLRGLILLLAFFYMLRYAGVLSLWYDDLATIHFAAEGESLSTLLSRYQEEAGFNPPLFYVFAYFWLRIAPYGTVYLKLPCILFCCGGIWLCGSAAKRLFGKRAAVFTALFTATSFFMVQFAAYTFRSFGLLFLLTSVLVHAYLNRLEAPEKKSTHIGLGIVFALLFYTNFMGVLVAGAFGLFDLILFAKKKIRLNCVISYLIGGIAFLPYFLYASAGIIGGHQNWWPEVPTLKIVAYQAVLLFSKGVCLIPFAAAVILLLVNLKHGSSRSFGVEEGCSRWAVPVLWLAVLWGAFVVGTVYIYSRFINPAGSFFVYRYFVCVIPPVVITAGAGMDRILTAIEARPGAQFAAVGKTAVILLFVIGAAVILHQKIMEYPGSVIEPYEETIEWIYGQEKAHEEKTLIVSDIGYEGGLYYYATHGLQRENLNFGTLDESSWESYGTVYFFHFHQKDSPESMQLLREHFSETDRLEAAEICGKAAPALREHIMELFQQDGVCTVYERID